MLNSFGGVFPIRPTMPGPFFDGQFQPLTNGRFSLWESPANKRLKSATFTHDQRLLNAFYNQSVKNSFVSRLLEHCCFQITTGKNESIFLNPDAEGNVGIDLPTGRGVVFIYEIDMQERCIQRIWLVTDQIASRKIYYSHLNNYFIWSVSLADLCGLLRRIGAGIRIDLSALQDFLRFLHSPENGTLIEGIRCVSPATILCLDRRQVFSFGYGRMRFQPESNIDFTKQMKDELNHLFDDFPLQSPGLLLSGGLDSSLLLSVGKEKKIKWKTYSVGFQGVADETDDAKIIAGKYGTTHHSCQIAPAEIENVLYELIALVGFPFGNPSAIAAYVAACQSKHEVQCMYSGLGSDELFGGHKKHLAVRYWKLSRPYFSLKNRIQYITTEQRGKTTGRPSSIRRYLDLYRFFDDKTIQELMVGPTVESHRNYSWLAKEPFLNSVFETDVYVWLADGLLPLAGSIFEGLGMTFCTPYCSDRMLHFASRIPFSSKVKGMQGKWILREVARDRLPKSVLQKPRQGFTLPMDIWLRGPLRFLIDDYLNSGVVKNRGLFDDGVIRRIIDSHLSCASDLSLQLWALITLEVWQRIFIDGQANPFGSER